MEPYERCSRGTQTPLSNDGLRLRFHFSRPSLLLITLSVLGAIVCLLNGCVYYVFWRPRLLLLRYSATTLPSPLPLALYAFIAGVCFEFVVQQLVSQRCLTGIVTPMTSAQKERHERQCCVLFVSSLIPVLVAHFVLIESKDFDASAPVAGLSMATLSLTMLSACLALSYAWSSFAVDWLSRQARAAQRLKHA